VADAWRRLLPCLVVVAAFGIGGGPAVVGADGGAPGEPASFFGTALDENGDALPSGTTIVAVVNDEPEGRITVGPAGEYGGEGAFDDKLRIDSAAGDAVTFRFADSDGPSAGSVKLEPGVFEENLTFPAATVEYIHPRAVANVEPTAVAPDREITLDGTESTAYGETGIETYRWSIERDGEEVATLDGEVASERFEENGTYDVELTVTDGSGRTNVTHATFDVDPTLDTTASTDDSTETENDDSTEIENNDSTSTDDGSVETTETQVTPTPDTSSELTSTGGGGTAGGGTSGGGSTAGTSGESTSVTSGGSADGSASDGGDKKSDPGSIPALSPGDETSGGFEIPDDPIAHEGVEIDDGEPNASGTTVAFDEPPIREVVLRNGSANGEMSVWTFDSIADGSPPLPNDLRIASVSLISVPTAHRDDPAIVRAVVDREWLAANGLRAGELTVYRLPNRTAEWQPLPTETTEVDDGVLVEAQTPGFSQFVIAGSVAPERTVASGESTQTPTREDVGETDENATGEANESTRRSSDDGAFSLDLPMLDRPTAALLALLAVTGLVGWIFVPRRRR
jgi:hypothetical protein